MLTLLYNYTFFENELTEIIGYVLTALEGLAIIVAFVRSIIRRWNDPDSLDDSIEKAEKRHENLLDKLEQRQKKKDNDQTPADVQIPPADGVEMIETDKKDGDDNV